MTAKSRSAKIRFDIAMVLGVATGAAVTLYVATHPARHAVPASALFVGFLAITLAVGLVTFIALMIMRRRPAPARQPQQGQRRARPRARRYSGDEW